MTLESKFVDISLDDPAISLKEWNMGYGDLLAAGLFDEEAIDYSGKHRYQIILAVHGDRPIKYVEDMGPEGIFPNPTPFVVLGGARIDNRFEVMHTVEQVREMADQLRRQPINGLEVPVTDLVQRYIDETENYWAATVGRSTFGLGGSTIRGLYL